MEIREQFLLIKLAGMMRKPPLFLSQLNPASGQRTGLLPDKEFYLHIQPTGTRTKDQQNRKELRIL